MLPDDSFMLELAYLDGFDRSFKAYIEAETTRGRQRAAIGMATCLVERTVLCAAEVKSWDDGVDTVFRRASWSVSDEHVNELVRIHDYFSSHQDAVTQLAKKYTSDVLSGA